MDRPGCDALTYLHAQNPPVIHRDVKPANIKITPEGRAMLVDFGIAKAYDPSMRTTLGARAVTPGFSPLEQYGLVGRTDARSDIYALGATLYALLTGQAPPEATDRGPDFALPAPRRLNPRVSPPVEAALLKALEVYPAGRFPSAAAFKAALGVRHAPAPLELPPVQLAAPAVPRTAPLAPGGTLIAAPPQTSPEIGRGPVSRTAANKKRFYWIAAAAAAAIVLLIACLMTMVAQEAAHRTQATQTEAALAAMDTAVTETARPPEGMALVPAGTFRMGSESGESNEKPVHEVYLDAFYIDAYEVTNAQFAEFLDAQGNQSVGEASWFRSGESSVHIRESSGQWQADSGYGNHPVIGVNWYGARAYCAWRDARLPTEAEWEKAARGGLEGMDFPWGDEAPTCVSGAQNGAQYGQCGGETHPAGSFAPNGYGLYDLAGNVWEWVSSLYQAYPYRIDDGREDPQAGGGRVVRGGSSHDVGNDLRAANRYWLDPTSANGSLGFRCSRSP